MISTGGLNILPNGESRKSSMKKSQPISNISSLLPEIPIDSASKSRKASTNSFEFPWVYRVTAVH